MQVDRLSRKISGAILMVALCGAPVAAMTIATPTVKRPLAFSSPTYGISPTVALSVLGSEASLKALCASTASTVVAEHQATEAQQTAAVTPATPATVAPGGSTASPKGCVLPVTDQPVPVSEAGVLPVAGGFNFLPLFAGIPAAALAASALGNGNGSSNPISPD